MAINELLIKYGTTSLLKLIPEPSIGMISVLRAILEVKKTTEMSANNGQSKPLIHGMKLM